MNTYVFEQVELTQMLKRDDYCFAFKIKENYNLYAKSANGNELCVLKKEMGTNCDSLLFSFLNNMKPVYKYIFCNNSNQVKHIINVMLMFLKINYGDIKKGGFSFCSHAQGFISFFDEREQAESCLEKEYKKNLPLVDYCFHYSKEKMNSSSEIYNTMDKCTATLKSLAEEMISNDKIYFMANDGGQEKLNESYFHSLLYKNTNFVKRVECDLDFKKKRLSTICFYYFLKSAGVDYKKRCYLAYIIYRYIEEFYDFTYNKLLEDAGSLL